MKVAQLIKELQEVDPNADVLLSIDEEGNGYNSVEDIQFVNYRGRFPDIEVGLVCLTKELEKQGYTEEDVVKGKSAVVLWP